MRKDIFVDTITAIPNSLKLLEVRCNEAKTGYYTIRKL